MRCCRPLKSSKAATATPTLRIAESGRYSANSSSTLSSVLTFLSRTSEVYMHTDVKALSSTVRGEFEAHAAYIGSLRLTCIYTLPGWAVGESGANHLAFTGQLRLTQDQTRPGWAVGKARAAQAHFNGKAASDTMPCAARTGCGRSWGAARYPRRSRTRPSCRSRWA